MTFHACDICGAEADAIHFVGTHDHPRDASTVVLSCPGHALGGVFVSLASFDAGKAGSVLADARLAAVFGPTLSPIERVRLAVLTHTWQSNGQSCPLCGHGRLSVSEANDGAALVYCERCEAATADLVAAMGLEMRDLFVGRRERAA